MTPCTARRSLRLFHLARLQAGGADVDPLGAAVHDGADALDVGVPSTLRAPVRVADAHAELRLLAADVAHGCHRDHLGTGSGTAKDSNGIQKPPNVTAVTSARWRRLCRHHRKAGACDGEKRRM